MTTLINQQKINRRKKAASGARLIPHLQSLFKRGRYPNRRLPLYIVSGITAVFIILFFSLSPPIAGMVQGKGPFAFPNTREVDELLGLYLDGGVNAEEREEIKLPGAAVLTSISPSSYTVQKGDTPLEIAQAFNLRLDTVLSFNNIRDVRKLKVGMELKLPEIDGVLYRVRKGDSLSVIAYRYGVELNDLLDANNLDSSLINIGQELFVPEGRMSSFDLKRATGELFIYPSRGDLSSRFGVRRDPFTGLRRMHYGIDLANDEGVAVKAAMEGVVAATGFNQKGYGHYVIIKHQGGFQTLYAHLQDYSVKKGQSVAQGQRIGSLGNSGRSTGPHLHFGIYRYQKPVDPLEYLF
jgi:murein DD-endopeptidase MepM/ murein hydrolase activator NlpD